VFIFMNANIAATVGLLSGIQAAAPFSCGGESLGEERA
jgi:hypothetical protein